MSRRLGGFHRFHLNGGCHVRAPRSFDFNAVRVAFGDSQGQFARYDATGNVSFGVRPHHQDGVERSQFRRFHNVGSADQGWVEVEKPIIGGDASHAIRKGNAPINAIYCAREQHGRPQPSHKLLHLEGESALALWDGRALVVHSLGHQSASPRPDLPKPIPSEPKPPRIPAMPGLLVVVLLPEPLLLTVC